ncbi:MAG: PTS sugar transporter subunit IIC [Lactovum sp.]
MDKLMTFFETKMAPIAIKLDQNRYLSAVKNGFMAAMPLLIIGSVFLLFAYLPITGYDTFMAGIFGENWITVFTSPNDISLSLRSLYVIVAMADDLAGHYKMNRMSGIFAALAGFLTLTPFKAFADESGNGIPASNLGAEGLFVAMITAILAIEIVRFVETKGWVIKMPETVPLNVSKSFSSLIPIFIVVLIFLVTRLLFEMTPFGSVQAFIFGSLQSPLTLLGGTLPAMILVLLIESLLWMFGIHGANIVGSVMQPIWLSQTAENATAFAAGEVLPNIVNYQFYSNFVKIGGSGATWGLLICLLLFAKSSQFKAVGKLSAIPGIFTINETITFGIPIVLNPIMFIPFVLAPIVICIMTYVAMTTGLVPYPNGVNIPWTTPPIISGFLVSGWQGALCQIVGTVISFVIYFPFFKVADKMAYEAEQSQELVTE